VPKSIWFFAKPTIPWNLQILQCRWGSSLTSHTVQKTWRTPGNRRGDAAGRKVLQVSFQLICASQQARVSISSRTLLLRQIGNFYKTSILQSSRAAQDDPFFGGGMHLTTLRLRLNGFSAARSYIWLNPLQPIAKGEWREFCKCRAR
jgi:hypothetical protein